MCMVGSLSERRGRIEITMENTEYNLRNLQVRAASDEFSTLPIFIITVADNPN